MRRLDWDKIRELWKKGYNDEQIAIAVGTNQIVICRIRKRLGLASKWKRGRRNHEFLRKELESKEIVFSKDYSKLEKLKLNRDFVSTRGEVRRISIPKVRMKKEVKNVKKQIIFYANGNTEKAFVAYMNRFPEDARGYLLGKRSILTKKVNFIRKYFGLNPIYDWSWEDKKDNLNIK